VTRPLTKTPTSTDFRLYSLNRKRHRKNSIMTNRKSTTGFPTSYRGSAYVTPNSPKGWLETDFSVFRNKIQFKSNKVYYNVSWYENFQQQSCRAVNQITEKHRTDSVSFHLKYWLKLTYHVVASTCMIARRTPSALPNDVMSKIQCGQRHSKLFGRRHSTLQSHCLFALAKLVLISDIRALWPSALSARVPECQKLKM